jgi:hypothetical protein
VSKGAQYILWRAQVHEQLSEALADVDLSVAFTRWLPRHQQHPALPDIPSLLAHPVVQQVLKQPQRMPHPQQQLDPEQQQEDMHVQPQQQQTQDCRSDLQQPGQQQQQQQQQPRHERIALVFGREEFGLSDDEVAACDIACAISIGRLQVRLLLKRWRQFVLERTRIDVSCAPLHHLAGCTAGDGVWSALLLRRAYAMLHRVEAG